MAVYKWSNVAVAMQSALAATKTLTAITKANPGVATSTTHGYSNGDYLVLLVDGMWQVNNRVVRVASTATDTFALEGIDTTGYDTFTSGTAAKVTFGTTINTILSTSTSGGTTGTINVTTIHDNQQKVLPGLPEATSYTMETIWDPANAGFIAMKAASDAIAQRAFRFTFGSGGPINTFVGYVSFAGNPGGTAQDKVTSGAQITQFGTATQFTS